MTDAYVKAWNCNLYFMEAVRVKPHEKLTDIIINETQYCFTIPEEEIEKFNNLSVEDKLYRFQKERHLPLKLIYANEGHHETSTYNYFYIKTKESLHTNIGSFFDADRLKIVHGEIEDKWFVRGMTRKPKLLYTKDITIPDILNINPNYFHYQKSNATNIRAMIEHEFTDDLNLAIKKEIEDFAKHVKKNYVGKDIKFNFNSKNYNYRNVEFYVNFDYSYKNDEVETSLFYIRINQGFNEDFMKLIKELYPHEVFYWSSGVDIDIFDENSINEYIDFAMKLLVDSVDFYLKNIPIKINHRYDYVKKLDRISKKINKW